MNIENALKIEGAMDPPELKWLAEQASRHKAIVEIGCWHGRSTTVLADNTDGVVYAVDHWMGSAEHNPPVPGLYESFCKNLKFHIDNFTVWPVRFPSVEAAAKFTKAHEIDMVFIDASHDYESVRADILAWRPLLCSGGLLCGHDYGYPPVTRAVQELVKNVQAAGCIWYSEVL